MDAEVDHYVILGLPSGEEGAKLSEEEIRKAYRSKVKKLHPDKRPDDPNAHHNFLILHSSYNILMDQKARHIFHQQAAKKQIKRKSRKSQEEQNSNSKQRRRKTDLDEREQALRATHSAAQTARDMEESIARRNEQLIARIKRDAAASKAPPAASALNKGVAKEAASSSTQCPRGHCQGDWLDMDFEAYQNACLTKFRKKDKNDIPKHHDL